MTDGLHTDHRRETFHAMAGSHPVYGGEAWVHAVATIVIEPAHKQRFARGAIGFVRPSSGNHRRCAVLADLGKHRGRAADNDFPQCVFPIVERGVNKRVERLRNPLKMVGAQGIEPWTSPV
jgi:hypothetical protein